MPTPLLKKYAEETGKTLSEIEKIWDEAKAEAAEKFKNKGPSYWAYVNATTRHKLGLATHKTRLKEYLELSHEEV